MTSLQKLKIFGESIGLTGQDLQNFIKEQQKEEHEQRTLEREREKQDRAWELEKIIQDKTWELERMKLQIEQQRLDQEARDKQAETELHKLKFESLHVSEEIDTDSNQTNAGLVKPKIPKCLILTRIRIAWMPI